VEEIDECVWGPDGISEVGGVGNDNLFEIDDVGDELEEGECRSSLNAL
jgi:hypothetical protein